MRNCYLGLLVVCAVTSGMGRPQTTFAQTNVGQPATFDYRLQAADQVEVFYRDSPEFNQTATVQPDGGLTLQLLGTVPVLGLTMSEARERITAEASKRLNEPQVSLALKDFDKPHFTVMGEVANPGRYELRGSLSAIDGLALAGGFKIAARHTQLLLIHRVNDNVGQTQLINYKAYEKPRPPGQQLTTLRPGDILIVPTSKLSKVERYVKILNSGVYVNPLQ